MKLRTPTAYALKTPATEFQPHFQPIVELSSGRICGYEALARERLASGNMVSCGHYFFEPGLDKTFLLNLDRAVRRRALQMLPQMPDDTFLTLNISPEWIDLLALTNTSPTIELVRHYGIDPSRIIIEITETAGNLEALQHLVSLYRQEGMRIAIDDYGAGHSELGRLIALEPDIIKLDMRFFKSAVSGGIAQDAIKSIGFMAERIGCDIICEGVETEKEFNFAVDCGAQMIQGFLFYQAGDHFTPPTATKPQVSELLKGFLSEKISLEKSAVLHYRAIFQDVQLLRKICLAQAEPTLVALPKVSPELIRFYVCNLDGTQLSPNYEYSPLGWHRDPSSKGLNWSARPFLYQVLALGEIGDRSEFTTRPYRDRASRQMLKTIGLKMRDNRILFVDYAI
ncbi:EAL domain-containing protein [Reinekea sp.]|jgi:EAL domain-containing protein (putative c-di-GMP-specific phosphodiesterase class I)|uniref:EAL domain-containing protein n=1 Tax=Reinekea sp. TaxID=1970455 RepID=UPI002A816A73|nr:EAL domain-containing protein [Reinekea sp.]